MVDEVKKLSPVALARVQQMKAAMNNYLQGVLDGMGLEGIYSIDENTGELKPVQKG